MVLYVVIAIVILIVIYIFETFNSFVKLKNQVKEAFSTMDVYLKKRWDLIPNIVDTVKEYASYEKETLKEIVDLRANQYDKLDNQEKADINNKITDDLSKIMIVSERYPELKANEQFQKLSEQLVQVEDEIANSRKYYNGAVKVYNNKVQMFPSNIFAKIFGYKEEKMFEINVTERNNIKVDMEG